MMQRTKRLFIFGCTAVGFLAGCGRQGYVVTVDNICTADKDRAAVMSAAKDVLAKMGFDIEKFDAGSGYIRTRPLSGAQAFEFWRSDNIGSFNGAEANIQSIRRTAELNVGERQGQVCAACAVKVERLSAPELGVGDGQAAVFSEANRTLQRMQLGTGQKKDMVWIALGRDRQLETKILREIKLKVENQNDRATKGTQ